MSRKGRLPKGAPRSAERQVFMFGRFAEPLPSDESDDSDFELCSDQETTRFVIATTVEEKQRSSQGKSRKTREKESNEIGNRMEQLTGSQNDLATMMTTGWSQLIPVELLIRIFQLVVDDTGSVPFLCRMSRVCKRWRDVACEPLLWRKVNLSPLALKCMRSATDATFERLAPARFTPVKVLNLDGWKKLTDKGLKAITTHCTQLQSIVLSQCDNLTSKGIASLADSCRQLIMVDVAMTKIDISCLSHLTKQLGNQLEEVSFRNCLRLRGEQILPYLQNCQNLTVLDLTGTNIRKLNVEKLQVGCPKLKELYLANLLLHSTPTSSDKHYSETRGFPQLETLCLACGSLGGLAMTDQFLYRILKGSTNLKLLDIRGLHKLTDKGLEKLPAISLQQLFLSDTQATFGIVAVLVNKWHFSLEVLDLSSNRYVSDEAMDLFRNFEMPRLHVLDLSSTNVTAEGVRKAVKGCPNLKDLNLTSCRGLPRGAKQRHDGARLNSLIRRLMDDSEQ